MESKKIIYANLQGIRGYAILLIFVSHCNFGLNPAGINYTTWFGGLGVSLFIMLSGFLLLENHWNKPIILKTYLKNKIIKFYPLHIATLILALPFAIKALASFDFMAWFAMICNLLLFQAWVPSAAVYFSYNAVSWYLSVTIFFILISPLILKFWNRQNSLKRVMVILVLLVVFEFSWCFLLKYTKNAHWVIYILPLIRCVDFLIGGGVWQITRYVKFKELTNNIVCIIGVIATTILLVASLNKNSEWFSVCVWTIPCIVFLFVASENTKLINHFFSNKFIKTIGDYSFEFFLIHQICIRYVAWIVEKTGLHSYALIAFLDFLVAMLTTSIWRLAKTKINAMTRNVK